MKDSFVPQMLPEALAELDPASYIDELVDATSALCVYLSKLKDSKVNADWLLPTFRQKEAISSSMLEGTKATLEEALINQIEPNVGNRNLKEISNIVAATTKGASMLRRGDFDDELICEIHRALLLEKTSNSSGTVGQYRTTQNYVGRGTGEITYVPPKPESVPELMKNLLEYVNSDAQGLRPLERVAIIHAQFETIHPFVDGNGRVGRILIPLYLYWKGLTPTPYLFVSESLEKEKLKYYRRLTDVRENSAWNEWVRFFLTVVKNQCQKNIEVVGRINALYHPTLEKTNCLIKSSNSVKIVDSLFRYPVFDSKLMQGLTKIAAPTLNRYLNAMVDAEILFTDGKRRNRMFFFLDVLELLRQ